ncbi:MAG TPA: VWA domain-containing protein [Bryobacteraceae bacterium]|nr:VWA domain-containing protein [Bryobacteraceae bacterium]
MRTLLVSLCLCLTAGITSINAEDDDGPRMLENQPLVGTNVNAHGNAGAPASIRVDVNMTLVPVAVLDSWGRNVLGLDRENFRVFDGTEPRPIVSFTRSDAPVSIGLIYDCSRSMSPKFKIARQAPAKLFEHLNPEDEAFLVTVSDRPELRHDFTTQLNDLMSTLLFVNPGGSTSLLDGVYLGLHQMKKAHNPRKALIIVSDGGDNNSRYSLRELAQLAAESDTQIFSICLWQSPQSAEEIAGPALLAKLSQVSGGINFMTSDGGAMDSTFAHIGVTLHNEYMLGYYPSGDAPAGKYRKIKVQVLVPAGVPKLQVFARSGYYVPEK